MNEKLKLIIILVAAAPLAWQASLQVKNGVVGERVRAQALVQSYSNFAGGVRSAGSSDSANKAKADAVATLRRQAIDPISLGVLAALAEVESEQSGASRLAKQALRLSRRDAISHILEIERAVRRGDVTSALGHYDVLFRTTTRYDEFLFPILSRALEDERIREDFVRYVRNDTPWLGRFGAMSTADQKMAPAWADIMVRSRGLPKSPGFRDMERQVLLNLSALSRFEDLKRTYLALPKVKANSFADLSLGNDGGGYAVAGWQLTDGAAARAAISRDEHGGNFELIVDVIGAVPIGAARKLLLLSPGSKRIVGNVLFENVLADINITCASAAGSIFLLTSAHIGKDDRKLSYSFKVPPTACTAQFVDLFVRSSGQGGGGRMTLSELSLASAE